MQTACILAMILTMVACNTPVEDGAGPSASTDPTRESSGSEGSTEPQSSTEAEAGSTTTGTTSTADDFGDTGVPGCADAPEFVPPIILDATHIRISTIPFVCDEPIDEPQDCSIDQFEAMLTVPDTSTPGTWTLPHPDVSLVVLQEWLVGYSELEGCYCEPASATTPFPVEVGTITLDVVETVEGFPMGLTFEGFDYAPLSGGTVVGTCQ